VTVLDGITVNQGDHPLTVSYAETSLNDEPLFLQESNGTPNSIDSCSVTEPDEDPRDADETMTMAALESSFFPMAHTNPFLQVSMSGIPPATDILSFAFLRPFGAVLEGRIIPEQLSADERDGSNVNTAPRFTSVVVFKILSHSRQCAENLLSLNEATGNCSTYSITVSSSLPLLSLDLTLLLSFCLCLLLFLSLSLSLSLCLSLPRPNLTALSSIRWPLSDFNPSFNVSALFHLPLFYYFLCSHKHGVSSLFLITHTSP
jgi:hypothetical protein